MLDRIKSGDDPKLHELIKVNREQDNFIRNSFETIDLEIVKITDKYPLYNW